MARLSESDQRVADWLLEHGLGASVRTLFGAARGREAAIRVIASRECEPRPGLYLLVTSPSGDRAWALPARIEFQGPMRADEGARQALINAEGAVRRRFHLSIARSVSLSAEKYCSLEGTSLGLVAALAYVDAIRRHSSRGIDRPVFVTGCLNEAGTVQRVNHLDEKVAAAIADLCGSSGIILGPPKEDAPPSYHSCDSLEEALSLTFGTPNVPLSRSADSLAAWLESVAHEPSADVLPRLEAIDASALRPADRARLLMHRGNHLRHVGKTDAAHDEHEAALKIANRLDRSEKELLELELWNTRLDRFDFEESLAWLKRRIVSGDFSSVQNEMRTRGTYARGLAMAGRYAESLVERRALLELHEHDQELQKELPQSLAELALVAALGHDAPEFDPAVAQMLALPVLLKSQNQPIYDTQSIVRGSVLLGREPVVAQWVDGAPMAGALEYAEVRSGAPLATHPRSSIVRAVARALRRVGRPDRALELTASVTVADVGLAAWVATLCQLENALALRDLGRLDDARAQLAIAQRQLDVSSPYATAYHRGLLSNDWNVLEPELDRVFY